MARPPRAKSALGGVSAADPILPTPKQEAAEPTAPATMPAQAATPALQAETAPVQAKAPAKAQRPPRTRSTGDTPAKKRELPTGKARASAYMTERQMTGMEDAWWTERVLDPTNAPRTRADWLSRALRNYASLTTQQRTKFSAALPLDDDGEPRTPRTWTVDANARALVDETETTDLSNQRLTSPTAFVKEAILYGYQSAAKRNGGSVLTAPAKKTTRA